MQVADFLFGTAALPHDFLHEPLLRILATGFAGASTAAASLNVSHLPPLPQPLCTKLCLLGSVAKWCHNVLDILFSNLASCSKCMLLEWMQPRTTQLRCISSNPGQAA